jgi:elongation factor Ts
MAAITASMVAELRGKTDAPMMECKKALTEAEGDMVKAEELLRVKLGSKAGKAAARVTAEGVIAIASGSAASAMLEVNCETDFVARGDDFTGFAAVVSQQALTANPADVEALLAVPAAGGETIDSLRRSLIAKIGENISVRRFVRVESAGQLGSYLHGTRIGTLVALDGGDAALARDLAMHVAASSPRYLAAADVPAEDVAKERAIRIEMSQNDEKNKGKPEAVLVKIVEGGITKWLNEITLLGQPFVKDDKLSVEKLLVAAKAQITRFERLEVGAGIEKKQDDFVAEVMAQAKGSGH